MEIPKKSSKVPTVKTREIIRRLKQQARERSIVRLHLQGISSDKIALLSDVDRSTVYGALRKARKAGQLPERRGYGSRVVKTPAVTKQPRKRLLYLTPLQEGIWFWIHADRAPEEIQNHLGCCADTYRKARGEYAPKRYRRKAARYPRKAKSKAGKQSNS